MQLARMESRQALSESSDTPPISADSAVSIFEWFIAGLIVFVFIGFVAAALMQVWPVLVASI